jgi:hypothetical protein
MSDPIQTTRADIVRAIVRAAIDAGAACQKARSFAVAAPDQPLRSVYDVMFEQAMEALKNA